MKWAEAFEAATTGGLEIDVIANDIVDPGAFAHQIDVGFSNTAHGVIVGVA